MKTSIKTFFETNKKSIMIGCVAVVLGAKALSFCAQQNAGSQAQQMQGSPNRMQQPNAQMQQGYNGNNDTPYAEQMYPAQQQQQNDWWGDMFGGDEQEGYTNQNTYNYGGYNTGAYTNAAGNNYGGNTGYTGTGYTGGGYTGNTNSGADYTSGYWKQQASQDAQHERFTDYIRDETKYEDASGNSYKLGSGYDYNYVNSTTNEYTQTNDASYDPNNSTTSSNWSAVTPSSYSSSTSAGDE